MIRVTAMGFNISTIIIIARWRPVYMEHIWRLWWRRDVRRRLRGWGGIKISSSNQNNPTSRWVVLIGWWADLYSSSSPRLLVRSTACEATWNCRSFLCGGSDHLWSRWGLLINDGEQQPGAFSSGPIRPRRRLFHEGWRCELTHRLTDSQTETLLSPDTVRISLLGYKINPGRARSHLWVCTEVLRAKSLCCHPSPWPLSR